MRATERENERGAQTGDATASKRTEPDAAEGEAPGTGILGDETLVRDTEHDGPPGIYPAPAAHTGGEAHPGPAEEKPSSGQH